MLYITGAILSAVDGVKVLFANWLKNIRTALSRARYHPEKHYMRAR